jgi:hypothetical protein
LQSIHQLYLTAQPFLQAQPELGPFTGRYINQPQLPQPVGVQQNPYQMVPVLSPIVFAHPNQHVQPQGLYPMPQQAQVHQQYMPHHLHHSMPVHIDGGVPVGPVGPVGAVPAFSAASAQHSGVNSYPGNSAVYSYPSAQPLVPMVSNVPSALHRNLSAPVMNFAQQQQLLQPHIPSSLDIAGVGRRAQFADVELQPRVMSSGVVTPSAPYEYLGHHMNLSGSHVGSDATFASIPSSSALPPLPSRRSVSSFAAPASKSG